MSGAARKQGAKSQVHSDNLPASTKTASTTNSTDNGAASGSGEEQPQASRGGSERSAGSPEPNCAICLGTLENKSFTDSCFHMFCFVCLQEWSKRKPECPLCKQPFKSIIHNVRSYNNYDQFYLDHHPAAQPPMRYSHWNFDRAFRYRTTLTMDHRYIVPPPLPLGLSPRYHFRSRSSRTRRNAHLEAVSTTAFRRGIYVTGRKVVIRGSQRRRTVTPDFFRTNPAQTHRLVPWLNRELNALLYSAENQMTFVLELIMDLIKRFPIDSDEFYEHIHPYLHENTRHFMHEFLSFARSPYSMHTYDTKAVYEASHVLSNSDSSSNSSDVVVVDDDDAEEAGRPGQSGPSALAARPSLFVNPLELPAQSNISATSVSGWDSPTPGPSWDLGGTSSQSPVNVEDSSSDASTIIDPTYLPSNASDAPMVRLNEHNSDGEEVIFVSYDKPWEERSPIMLSSSSDNEVQSSDNEVRHKFAKRLKKEHKRRKSSPSRRSRSRHSMLSQLTPDDEMDATHRASLYLSQSASSSKKGKHKKRHHEHTEVAHQSSSGSSSKRKHGHLASSSRSRSPHKKRRRTHSEGERSHSASKTHRKKHKHKKHGKNKAKRDKQQEEDHQSGNSHRAVESTFCSSTRMREERGTGGSDHCKKHPSGHKKSHIGGRANKSKGDSRAASGSGHYSDTLNSDTSTSSTLTTMSTTDSEPSYANFFSRQQRVQQVLEGRRQANPSFHHSLPIFPGMDAAPSLENISRLARLLTTMPLNPMPGPSYASNDDPVVISASSDEDDSAEKSLCGRKRRMANTDNSMAHCISHSATVDTATSSVSDDDCDIDVDTQKSTSIKRGKESVSGDNLNVAKTVVVPAISHLGVPTAAIDFSSRASPCSSPVNVDGNSDVDVEVQQISYSRHGKEADSMNMSKTVVVQPVSAPVDLHSVFKASSSSSSPRPCVIDNSIGGNTQRSPHSKTGKDGASLLGMSSAPDLSRNLTSSASSPKPLVVDECIDVESISSEEEASDSEVVDVESLELEDTDDSVEAISSASGYDSEVNARSERNTSVVTEVFAEAVPTATKLASLKIPTAPKPPYPFSIQSILNRDVFMGVETSSQPLSGSSVQDLSFPHSQPQTPECSAGLRSHLPSSGYVSKLDQLLPQRLLSQQSQDGLNQFDQFSLRTLFPQQSVESKASIESTGQGKESQLDGECGNGMDHQHSPSGSLNSHDDSVSDTVEEENHVESSSSAIYAAQDDRGLAGTKKTSDNTPCTGNDEVIDVGKDHFPVDSDKCVNTQKQLLSETQAEGDVILTEREIMGCSDNITHRKDVDSSQPCNNTIGSSSDSAISIKDVDCIDIAADSKDVDRIDMYDSIIMTKNVDCTDSAVSSSQITEDSNQISFPTLREESGSSVDPTRLDEVNNQDGCPAEELAVNVSNMRTAACLSTQEDTVAHHLELKELDMLSEEMDKQSSSEAADSEKLNALFREVVTQVRDLSEGNDHTEIAAPSLVHESTAVSDHSAGDECLSASIADGAVLGSNVCTGNTNVDVTDEGTSAEDKSFINTEDSEEIDKSVDNSAWHNDIATRHVDMSATSVQAVPEAPPQSFENFGASKDIAMQQGNTDFSSSACSTEQLPSPSMNEPASSLDKTEFTVSESQNKALANVEEDLLSNSPSCPETDSCLASARTEDKDM